MGVIKIGHATHVPVLIKVLRISTGPVLELGVGGYSTVLLHLLCTDMDRLLVSLDSDMAYVNYVMPLSSGLHKIEYVEDWDKADILKPWSVAFVDHKPGPRRGLDAGRLANYAEYVVCHDSEPKADKIYEYSKMYSLFKYQWEYTKIKPYTKVLSNFHNLDCLGG